jgi:dTDP-4-dehydrorhamnose reductase
MRIIVTGASGRLGTRLIETLTTRGHAVMGADLPDFDVTDFYAIKARTADIKPDVVLHSAAWTDVDGCARDPKRAVWVNGLGAQNVANAAAAVGAAALYVSTNEVFDGTGDQPYQEYDTTRPINSYGYSKWVGEQATMSINPRHYVVRTAWLFAHGGKNFLQTILDAAVSGKPLRIVSDEVANPTYADDLAQAIAQLIESERFGIYHFVNEGACSRYEFGRYVLDQAGYAETPIEAIQASDWKRASTPPLYSPLENLAGKMLGITLRPWQQAVDAFLEKEQLLIRS